KERYLRYAKCSRLIRKLRERFPALSDRLLYGIRTSTIYLPPIGEGLHYQVSEVNRCLRTGKLESDIMPLHESLRVMCTIDRVREQSEILMTKPCEICWATRLLHSYRSSSRPTNAPGSCPFV